MFLKKKIFLTFQILVRIKVILRTKYTREMFVDDFVDYGSVIIILNDFKKY